MISLDLVDDAPKSQDAESSQQSQTSTKSSTTTRGARGPVRRLVAQPTKLEAVDDPLGPLGPLGGNAGPGADSQADEPPAPPQKEQVVIRTTMPQPSQQKRPGPVDPHRIDDDDFDRPSGPRPPPPVQAAQPNPVRTSAQPSVSVEKAAKPSFQITVGDPHKVGDLTSSHIVYSVRTRVGNKPLLSGNNVGVGRANTVLCRPHQKATSNPNSK